MFNIALLDNPNNSVSRYRSKALGEPPLLLGISIWAAAKNALAYAARLSQLASDDSMLLHAEEGIGGLFALSEKENRKLFLRTSQ